MSAPMILAAIGGAAGLFGLCAYFDPSLGRNRRPAAGVLAILSATAAAASHLVQ